MYRVLVPVDDDPDRARGQAAFVAELPGGTDEVEAIVTHALTPEQAKAPDEIKSVDRVETVRQVRDYLDDHDVEYQLAEASVPPADGILELADQFDVDQIVMGSRKRSPTGKVIFGSVAQQVLLEGDIPVTVVGAREA